MKNCFRDEENGWGIDMDVLTRICNTKLITSKQRNDAYNFICDYTDYLNTIDDGLVEEKGL